MNRAAVEADWRARGFSCDPWTDPPGQVWEDFVHATDELVMLVDGAIELEFLGKTIRPRAGEEILIPARASHTVRNVGGTTARWLYGYHLREASKIGKTEPLTGSAASPRKRSTRRRPCCTGSG
jgi:hypothetical protein